MEDINTKVRVLKVKCYDVVSLFLGPDSSKRKLMSV